MANVIVKMTTTAAGPDGVWLAGTFVTVDQAVAAQLVAGGFAVPQLTVVVETATLAPPENALSPTAKRRVTKG